MKTVLITGANSYIGTSFESYAKEHYGNQFSIFTIDMIDGSWKNRPFRDEKGEAYDIVFHVAGLAHADVGNVSDETKKKYYAINTDLAIECCRHAKESGCGQFVFMSSAIIYGDSAPLGKSKMITKDTEPEPSNFYGDSKWQADKGVRALASDGKNGDRDFVVTVLRPPMIYGKGSKGNYPTLSKMARKLPIFPNIDNSRSMLYIDNLCEFLCKVMINDAGGIYWPQNAEYSKTSDVVKLISKATGHNIIISKAFNWPVRLASIIPGKISGLVNKAFGNLTYAQNLSQYDFDYQKYNLEESIKRTEAVTSSKIVDGERNGKPKATIWIIDHYSSEPKNGGIQRQFDFANELSKRGYRTVIVSSAFSHYTHSYITDKAVEFSQFAPNGWYAYVHTSSYASNGGLGRVKNMFSFMFSAIRCRKTVEQHIGKPDVVMGASVHPLAWISAHHIAHHYKVRFIAEVRDLWPEMWLLNGEKGKHDPMVLFFGAIEKWAYRKADKIIYSMLYGDKYICGKLGFSENKVALIEQPMDCDKFDKNSVEHLAEVPKEISSFIGFDENGERSDSSLICVFTGYYMVYEGVHVMLKAAKELYDRNIPVKFLFVGSGAEEDAMRQYVKDNSLTNVLIYGRISKELIPSILRTCDVCLAHCATEGKEESFKYGVSKNKVNEYLYSGNPVIYGRDDEQDPVAKYGGGFVVKPFRHEQFVKKIEEIYNMAPQERDEMGKNGQDYIIKYHRVDSLVDKLLETFGV